MQRTLEINSLGLHLYLHLFDTTMVVRAAAAAVVVMVSFPPPHSTALAYDDGHENHPHKAEDTTGEHHPQSRTPVHCVVELRQWPNLVLPNEDEREVDPEHGRANEHGKDRRDEGDDAHDVGFEEKRREQHHERQPRRD